MRNAEVGMSECGSGNAEVGMRNENEIGMWKLEILY